MVLKKPVFGLLVGTRGFFNPKLAAEGRRHILSKLEKLGYKILVLPEDATPSGSVETPRDARKYARFFNEHRGEIGGIIVTLPNFGDEIGIVTALNAAALKVPVLVHAFDDELDKEGIDERRDSFCGKLSVCNNLRQYGIPFTNTMNHTGSVESELFEKDVHRFAGICRVVRGLRGARIGAVGARPAPFQTVRASEKLFQSSGITVVTVDLSEIISGAQRMADSDPRVVKTIDVIRDYGRIPPGTDNGNVMKLAKLSASLEQWINENEINAAAVQCWTSVQENYGCAICTPMSMLGNNMIPMACEVDIAGAVSMYTLSLASEKPSALLDWNNNYGDDRDKCICVHCGNFPKDFIGAEPEISSLDVLGGSLGFEKCFGAVKGKVQPGPMTYFRIMTDDVNGKIKTFLGEGEFTADPTSLAGSPAVCKIPRLQVLMDYMVQNGFPHHGAFVRSHCADIIREAISTYFNWDLYRH